DNVSAETSAGYASRLAVKVGIINVDNAVLRVDDLLHLGFIFGLIRRANRRVALRGVGAVGASIREEDAAGGRARCVVVPVAVYRVASGGRGVGIGVARARVISSLRATRPEARQARVAIGHARRGRGSGVFVERALRRVGRVGDRIFTSGCLV